MYFLKIHISKNTRNRQQCHSVLTFLFFVFLSWMRWVKNYSFQKMKKKKTSWKYHCFTQVWHKSKSHDLWFLLYWLQWMGIFFVILSQFCCFSLITAWKIKFEKIKKCNDTIDAAFLRYRVWQTEIFVILGYFMLFYYHLLVPQKPEKWKFWKNKVHLCTKNLQFLRYCVWQTEIGISGSFLLLYPHSPPLPPPPLPPLEKQKRQNFENVKKLLYILEILSIYKCLLKNTIIWCTNREIQSE